jgi:hypothetical protein
MAACTERRHTNHTRMARRIIRMVIIATITDPYS